MLRLHYSSLMVFVNTHVILGNSKAKDRDKRTTHLFPYGVVMFEVRGTC